MAIVFVYGSLKRGFPNHNLLKASVFLGAARTIAACYRMLDLGHYPAVLEGGDCRVAGEAYEVDDKTLIRLDILEHNGILYERKEVKVEVAGRRKDAWTYFFIKPPKEAPLVEPRGRTVTWK